MKRFYERKFGLMVLTVLLLASLIWGCSSVIPPKNENVFNPTITGAEKGEGEFDGLSVHYLDVGQGDCILICLPNGESVMIDCGNSSSESVNCVLDAFKAKEIDEIDYLILTHPELDHIGGVRKALKDVGVKKIFHPDIPSGYAGFEEYYAVIEFLKDKGAEMQVSVQGLCFGEDYKLAILLPLDKTLQGSSYRDFIFALQPNDNQINDLSPYVYLEYKGYRFLFAGDNSSKQEERLLNEYRSNKFDKTFASYNLNIKLEDIDFLKVAHHGSEDSTSQEFVSLLKPKHSIISVSGDNIYGHPHKSTQARILGSSENAKIYRTDVKGTVSVFIKNNGEMQIKPL